MIDAIVSLAKAHYEHTGQRFEYVFLGPRAYAALEVETNRRYSDLKGSLQADGPVEFTVDGLRVVQCAAEGMLFR